MFPHQSIILMGVSGAGKTQVGLALGKALGIPFLDADDFHPASNREKMHAGIPLTDADRQPWLEHLNKELAGRQTRGEPAVLACSALRKAYRDTLRLGLPDLVFVHLRVDPATIEQRVSSRPGHFFPAKLVESQFATLELPQHAFEIDATQPIEKTVEQVVAFMKEKAGAAAVANFPTVTGSSAQ
ncbi:MAG: gluconokinase [Verrucomicrobia bacterium]|nr:gluconokinase [Verrucomicrobiota bacterium]